MSAITLHLPPDTEKTLRSRATKSGKTIEAYVEQLVEDAVAKVPETEGTAKTQEEFPRYISEPRPSDAEFKRLLAEMASPPIGKVLPPDFSRDDIYDDHD